jgi:hypothetical protein
VKKITDFDLTKNWGRYEARKYGFDVPKQRPGMKQVVLDDHIEKTATCWLWTGAKNVYGYGSFQRGRRRCYAHREMWERSNGKSATGLVIRHTCDNRACVNPAHLLSGTHGDNTRDRVERNRQAKGESIAVSKLTEEQVKDIRRRWVPRKFTRKQLAAEYGVSIDLIHKIVNRILWRHVA